MPKKSKFTLPPLDLGDETLGQRIAKFRKKEGLTQVELAEKMGLIQTLISDYERDRTRPHPEMLIRLALALKVSTDQLLGLKPSDSEENTPDLKIVRRIKKIQELPPSQQKTLLRTIDTFIKAAEK
ncbi:MAG: helix-turn-helix transcriptional regulator [Nitrospirota bacterium]